jgi:HEAT repeat protein
MLQISVLALTALLLQGAALDSPSPKERQAAIEQMAKPGNIEAIPAFESALKKESKSDLRAELLSGLVRIGGSAVPPVIARSLATDLDKDVRLQAVESLQRLYIPAPDTGTIKTLFNSAKNVVTGPQRPTLPSGVVVDKVALEALATAMQKDSTEEVRAAAARVLGSLMAKEYVPVMITTLEDPQNVEHKTVRKEIVMSLGVIRDASAGPAVQKTLRDRDAGIMTESIIAIGLMGYAPARPQLEDIFRTDTRREMKEQSLESLAMLRDPGGKPLFESLLMSTNDFYREKAAEGLARTDYDAAPLVDLLKMEKKANVRNAMTFALVSSNHDDNINELTNALNSRLSAQAEMYLFELGKYKGKVALLNGYLRSSDPKVRAGMARILGRIGDPSSRAPLDELTKDPNTDVMREAVNALRQMNTR